MARYALIQIDSGLVENVIEWDGVARWSPPDKCDVIQSDTANIGDIWDGKVFAPPPIEIEVAADSMAVAKTAYATALTTDQKLAIIAKQIGLTDV